MGTTTNTASEAQAPVRDRVVRIAPPFAFEAVDAVVGVLLNAKDCHNGGHHCTLTIEAAELAHAKLAEAIAAAKAQKAAK